MSDISFNDKIPPLSDLFKESDEAQELLKKYVARWQQSSHFSLIEKMIESRIEGKFRELNQGASVSPPNRVLVDIGFLFDIVNDVNRMLKSFQYYFPDPISPEDVEKRPFKDAFGRTLSHKVNPRFIGNISGTNVDENDPDQDHNIF